jgi:hypothetical protein
MPALFSLRFCFKTAALVLLTTTCLMSQKQQPTPTPATPNATQK